MRQGFSSLGLSGVGSLSLQENRTEANKKMGAKTDNLNFKSIVMRGVETKQLEINSLYYQDSIFGELVVLPSIKTEKGNNVVH
jgi:hypothetical protein